MSQDQTTDTVGNMDLQAWLLDSHSDVRRRLRSAIEAAKLRASERRTRTDEATKAYEAVLETVAVPAFHTVVNALVGEGHRFKVTTPGMAVNLAAERSATDFIELSLDSDREVPAVMLRSSRGRGRRAVILTTSLMRMPFK